MTRYEDKSQRRDSFCKASRFLDPGSHKRPVRLVSLAPPNQSSPFFGACTSILCLLCAQNLFQHNMATPGPESEAGSELSFMGPPQPSTSRASPAPSVDGALPPAAAKPKRRRSTKEKAPGPGKNWRKGLKGALGKSAAEGAAAGSSTATGDAVGSTATTPAASSPGGSAHGATAKPRAKRQKTTAAAASASGPSPAPEAGPSKDAQQINKVSFLPLNPPAFPGIRAETPQADFSIAATYPQGMPKPILYMNTPATRKWRSERKLFTNVAGYVCALPVLIGSESSKPFSNLINAHTVN